MKIFKIAFILPLLVGCTWLIILGCNKEYPEKQTYNYMSTKAEAKPFCECCGDKLYIRWSDRDYFPFYHDNQDEMEMLANDTFPLGQCEGAKGILVMNDATVYFEYNLTEFWKFIVFAKGGINI